ncbi:MAG TPA: FAD-dependent oxidoreductase [Conexibacter sp.]|nr:FAD-dependent oxidoreductase [Conexibacter sp.]
MSHAVDRLRRPDGAPPRVLVAGGGVAALELVLALRALAGARVAIELVAPERELRYPPLDVVEPFGLAPPRIELAEALAPYDVPHRLDAIEDVEVTDHSVRTRAGALLHYEALAIAIGARRVAPPAGMLAFTGRVGRERFAELLHASETGIVRSLLFVVPATVGWPLPLYELAIMTARRLRAAGSAARVTLATAERAPLELFGGRPSGQLLERLRELGIAFVAGVQVERMLRGEVRLAPGGRLLSADRVVTLPALAGPQLTGLPVDAGGFLPVDAHGAVRGAYDVYAAGDAIAYPIKHGGLATQQADAVAEELAARVGVPLDPAPFRPVLRGMLLTGAEPQFLEAGVGTSRPDPAGGRSPLWWPPAKVAGRHVAPFLAARLGQPAPVAPVSDWTADAIPLELAGAVAQ